MPIWVFADDLTGALDTAAVFHPHAYTRTILDASAPPGEADVVVMDTASRHLSAPEVSAHLAPWFTLINRDQSPSRLYNKVDALLRGPVGAEISALLLHSQQSTALLCPAFPATGRTVQDGKLCVHGVRLEDAADVRHILEKSTTLRVETFSRRWYQQELASLVQYLDNTSHGPRIIVCDAQDDGDLARLAEVITRCRNVIPCGSSALARQLGPIWLQNSSGEPSPALPRVSNLFMVSGSQHPASQAQVKAFAKNHPAAVVCLNTAAFHKGYKAWMAERERVAQQIAGKTLWLLYASASPSMPASQLSHSLGVLTAGAIAATAGSQALAVMATGGDTARGVCDALGVRFLDSLGDVYPGIVLSRSRIGRRPAYFVTKSGGYGTPEVLETLKARMYRAKN